MKKLVLTLALLLPLAAAAQTSFGGGVRLFSAAYMDQVNVNLGISYTFKF